MKKQERQNHIKTWRKSGQSKKQYSESMGIKYPTFISWFKNTGEEQVGGFVKVEKVTRSTGFELVFPNGIRLYTEDRLSLDLLKTLQNV